jgi:RNA polymerase sigma-70 factor (ECF subfamily)
MGTGGSEHTSLSDLGLMALVRRGDEGALAEFYDRHAATAFALAMRVLRDRRDAEDAVQEAFTTLWRSAAEFNPARSSPSTWLLVLTHRRAVDLVRREARRPTARLEPAVAASIPDESAGPGHSVWLSMLREQILQALERLPEGMRELLELAYFGGYSQSELAARLDMPLGTVKTRMARAVALLREDMTMNRDWVRHE